MTTRLHCTDPWTQRSGRAGWTTIAAGMLFFFILAPAGADTTTVLDFDPPAFSAGQVVSALPGITFPDSPVVFTPASISTFSAPNALRSAASCDDFECTSGGWRLRMAFAQGVSALNVRAGSDESVYQFCFPEGTSCPYFARLRGYDAAGATVADSRDVLIADSFTGGRGPISTLISITDCAGRIRSADIVVGNEILSLDRHPGRVQIDHLSFTVPSQPCSNQPNPPSVVITSPVAGQYFDEYWRVAVSGRVTAPGGVFAFCGRTNETGFPAAAQCLQANAVRADGSFGPLYMDTTRLVEGANTLAVHVQDFWGQTASASVQIQLPAPQVDVRIVGMEVTQGIQRGDVPPNVGVPLPYNGVSLARGGTTVVRVFANRSGQGPTRQVSCRLYGQVGPYYLEPTGFISPDNGRRDLARGSTVVTLAERADPAGAFVFTLPLEWTRRGTIDLRAVINPTLEFETPGFEGNNSMTVTNVPFTRNHTVTVSPVEIIWTDSSGSVHRPPPPNEVFQRAAEISPLPAGGLLALPYAGTIDVTDIVDLKLKRDAQEDRIFERVANFGYQQLPGFTIGVALDLDIGLERLVVFGWPPRFEPIAIVHASERPITIAAHEMYHALGFFHAGTNCGNSFPSQSWPPDDRGLIQGFGLDRQPGSGGTGLYRIIAPGAAGQPPEYFDLMSYCISGDNDAWISVQNWEAFGGALPSGAIPADLLPAGEAGDYQPTGSAAKPGTQTVHASLHVDVEAKTSTLRVRKGDGRGFVTGPRESPYVIEVRDGSGNIVSEAPMAGVLNYGKHHGHFSYFGAEVLAENATLVRVLRNGKVVAERLRSRSLPSVQVIAPAAGETIPTRGDYVVRWKAEDADGDPLEARVDYSADDGVTYKVLTSGATGGSAKLPVRLFNRSSRARIRVVVNDGFDDTESVSDSFSARGGPPEARILSPQEGSVAREGDHLQLSGEAFDDSSLSLDGGQLKWFAGDRFLGTGRQSVAGGLVHGPLEIRLEATDSLGRVATATFQMEVSASCFREDFSGPATTPDGCSMTVRTESWKVLDGHLLGTTAADEGWAWAGSPPVVGLADADYGIQYRFLSHPETEVGRHGGIMFCSALATRRGDIANAGYTLDWIDRAEDHGLRLIKWKGGFGETLAIGGSELTDPPDFWRVQIDGSRIRCHGDGRLLIELEDAEFRGGYFGVWAWTGQEVSADELDFAADCGADGKDDLRIDYLPCRFPARWRYQSVKPDGFLYADLSPIALPDGAGVSWGEPAQQKDPSLLTGLTRELPKDALLVQPRRGVDNVVSWSAPGPGKVSITGYLGIAGRAVDCAGGVTWTIYRNDEFEDSLLAHTIEVGGQKGWFDFALEDVAVRTGDAIRFRAASRAQGPCAQGLLSASIGFAPATGKEAAGAGFRRGDVDGDGVMNISDPIVILGFLFLGSPTSLPCPAAADGNDDDVLNLSDAISLLAFEFLGGSPPREPFSACGTDPTPGALGCTGSPNCR